MQARGFLHRHGHLEDVPHVSIARPCQAVVAVEGVPLDLWHLCWRPQDVRTARWVGERILRLGPLVMRLALGIVMALGHG
eukprot:7514133-Lingulodinium_polyedra.AAC.1